jgi:hypothetical protein
MTIRAGSRPRPFVSARYVAIAVHLGYSCAAALTRTKPETGSRFTLPYRILQRELPFELVAPVTAALNCKSFLAVGEPARSGVRIHRCPGK